MFFLILKIAAAIVVLFALAFAALAFYMGTKQREYARMPDSADLQQRIDQLGRRYIEKRPKAALAIGVLQKGKRHTAGYGRVGDSNSSPPTAQTLFEIGSVTKVFTAIALARLADEGKLTLDDPIQNFLPKNLQVPQKDDQAITLKHLATHTSGLRRLPGNLFKVAKDKHNPYANYTAAHLYEALTNTTLQSTPGEKANYSNFGVALLGHLLELRAGIPYERMIKELICAPLEMADTTISLSGDQKTRLAPGHDTQARVVPNWDFDVMAPAGAFRSTAEDMLKFLDANLRTNSTPLSKALQQTHRRHFQHWSGDCGLGWQIMKTTEGLSIRWHNGGTGGYVSFIGFDRQHQTAVVVLSSYGDAFANDNAVDKMGVEILKLAAKISLR